MKIGRWNVYVTPFFTTLIFNESIFGRQSPFTYRLDYFNLVIVTDIYTSCLKSNNFCTMELSVEVINIFHIVVTLYRRFHRPHRTEGPVVCSTLMNDTTCLVPDPRVKVRTPTSLNKEGSFYSYQKRTLSTYDGFIYLYLYISVLSSNN